MQARVSVQEFLRPKRMNMRTANIDVQIARAATMAEIEDDLAGMGIEVPVPVPAGAGALVGDEEATVGYGYEDVVCREVEFHGLEGTPDYWSRRAD